MEPATYDLIKLDDYIGGGMFPFVRYRVMSKNTEKRTVTILNLTTMCVLILSAETFNAAKFGFYPL
jgi:hypothetical protein